MPTPYMNYDIPIIDVDPDPLWSEKINNALSVIDAHDHITVGKPIVTAAIQIDADLSFQGLNAIDLRSIILQNLNFDPSDPGDLTSVYVKNGNLFYNNDAGSHVQITSGTGLNVSVGVANAYDSTAINSDHTILNTDTTVYYEIDCSSNQVTVFLPDTTTVVAGRFYIFKDTKGFSETNPITFFPSGSDNIDNSNTFYKVKKTFGSWMLVTDAGGNWFVSNYSNNNINNSLIKSTGNDVVITGLSNNVVLQTNTSEVVLTSTAFETEVQDIFLGGANSVHIISGNGIDINSTTGVTIEGDTAITGKINVSGSASDSVISTSSGTNLTLSGGTVAATLIAALEVNAQTNGIIKLWDGGSNLIQLDSSAGQLQLTTATSIGLASPTVNSFGDTLNVTANTSVNITTPSFTLTTARYGVDPRTFTRIIRDQAIPGSTNWTVTLNYICNVSTIDNIAFPINLPNGASVASAIVSLNGASGHGALPASMPQIIFTSMNYGGSLVPIGGAATDPSATVGDYELQHDISLSQSFTVNALTTKYFLTVLSEGGANALAGMRVYSAQVTYSVSYVDEGS